MPTPRKVSATKQRSFFDVSPEMLEATSNQIIKSDTSIDNVNTSDLSPCCEEVIKFLIEDQPEEEEVECQQNGDIDGDSLDEGLGDISRDDTIELLVEENENEESHKVHNTSPQAIIMSAKRPKNLKNPEPDHQTSGRSSEDPKERRPSRISFETPL